MATLAALHDTRLDRQEAFIALLRTQGPRLRRLAAGYAPANEAADLYQEMLLQIWRSLPSYRGEAALDTWAYRIALNTGISQLRREIKRREVMTASDASQPVEETAGNGLQTAEQARILDDFLASLGRVDRSVMLAFLEGFSHEQMAEVVGCSVGAIAVRISRLKAAFKRRYLGG
jgi:RNA polymerase sigma-70 factor (ECF subfamily)